MTSWRRFFSRSRMPHAEKQERSGLRLGIPPRRVLARVLPLLALTALHLVLFPPIRTLPSLRLEAGDIAEQEIRAPFAFRAPRPRAELDVARLEASRRVEPVYVLETAAERRNDLQLRRLLERSAQLASNDSLSADRKLEALQSEFRGIDREPLGWILFSRAQGTIDEGLQATASRLMQRGIVDTTPRGNYTRIHVVDPVSEEQSVREVDRVVLSYRVSDAVIGQAGSSFRRAEDRDAAAAILSYLLTPNLSYDDAATEERRKAGVEAVPNDREYARNERILDSGVRVGRDEIAVLQALEQERRNRALARDTGIAVRLRAGRTVLVVFLLAGLCFTLAGRYREILLDYRSFLLVCVLLALHLILAWATLGRPELGPEAVPVVMLVMLATILFGEGPAARIAGAGLLLLALLPGISASTMVVWVVVTVAGMRVVRRVRNRNQFYKAIGAVSVAYLFSFGALTLGQTDELGQWARPMMVAIGSGVLSTALTLFLLPIFESIFEVTTDLTLLELSDLNHPLLRRMALESPGTFHHSQVVGTLSEAAARAIGANSLRTRVGANYHDIGKMLKPRYYVENQRGGPNAHDELSPQMSALVIAAHVRDGVELGKQWGLPKVVTDFIPEHHGTSVMRYFYHKALERDDGATVKVDDFRYPGPKPQSRETAIVMLADGVEASTRSLRRPTPSRIREMVRSFMERRMEEGEMDDCGLTMRELAGIREAFVPILVGIHHQRVAYPGQKEHEDKKEKESLENRSRSRRGSSSVASQS